MTEAPPTAGLAQRIHAWMLAHLCARYERMVADRKRPLLGNLRGSIVEIGPGAGPNLKYYSAGITWVGIDPNPYTHGYLRQAAAQAGLRVELRSGVAERIPAENSSVDAVVSTLVLCSVQAPAAALQEVLRVLKPGGQFVFIEHVAAARGSQLRRWQDALCPLWRRLADGCHPNRETGMTIEQAGFDTVHCEHFRLPLGPVATQIAGFATKKSLEGAHPC